MKMVTVYLNLSIFAVFLKNRNIISKIRKSKVTDYAALSKFFKRKIAFISLPINLNVFWVLKKNVSLRWFF